MEKGKNPAEKEGWGQFFDRFVDLPVVNKAIGGRSARSFTEQGRFQDVSKLVAAGDWVVIEFGHNDGGAFHTEPDNLRTPCGPGQTCKSKDGKVVKSFETYMTEAGKLFAAKGARVIMSSATPNNLFEKGQEHPYTPNQLPQYARNAAKALGANGFYVDHGLYTAKAYKAKGNAAVNGYYPVDHTHTNAKGAEVVAEAFAKAVVCAKIPLAEHIKRVGDGGC